MLNWILKKLFVDSYIKQAVAWLIKVLDGRKRYLAIFAFILVQGEAVLHQVKGMELVNSYLDVVIDVLRQSITLPTSADLGVWGFLIIALFDALRKAVTNEPVR